MQKKERSKPELLAPAGSMEKLKTAIHYGADAVYLAGQRYSLRAHAGFRNEDILAAVDYAHEHDVKVYVTVNIFAHNRHLTGLPEYLLSLKNAGVDGLIIADPGIFSVAARTVPELPVHLSTQANVTNRESALFWQKQGARRLNLARELTLDEIKEIRTSTNAELEIFVHGALCVSYSGRCSLSLYLTRRDANLGDCAHPCRYNYSLLEEKRPGQFFPVEEDQHGTYIFNSKDLCLLNRLPELILAGADALKIEGRMKSLYYVAAVVRVYRAAVDYLFDKGTGTELPPDFMDELLKVGTRGYTENFITGPPGSDDMLYEGARINQIHAPLGVVRIDGNRPLIEVRNPFFPGEGLEYLGRGLSSSTHKIIEIQDRDGKRLEKANPGNLVNLKTEPPAEGWKIHALIRRNN